MVWQRKDHHTNKICDMSHIPSTKGENKTPSHSQTGSSPSTETKTSHSLVAGEQAVVHQPKQKLGQHLTA
jgi:hypothetical protein